MASRGAKTRQDAPRCAQEGPKTAQDASKTAQDASKTAQDAPKMPQDLENGAKMEPSWHQNPFKIHTYVENAENQKNLEKPMKNQ